MISRPVSAPAAPNVPRPARVLVNAGGQPVVVDGEKVAEQRNDWLVEGWWWTEAPVRRRYWQVVTVTGRDRVLFHDLLAGGWYAQT